ncbi:hypothetical protein RND71_024297 [Anisodus tanguticus]|uniref:Uncharacterized protein n=1 Tax=Anisodus tanguticus TaxID=243964 RepID=A0AAE1RQS9_9SOLA|nr:hypothetical protein RND71_024297 [Anisodus tanguticus]
MSYLASKSWPVCINIDTDDTNLLNQEIQIDSAVLMSFLDEPHMEYCDDEKLRSLIQSLEAELDYPITYSPTAPNLDCYEGDCINSSTEIYHYEDNLYAKSAPDGEDSSEELVDVDFSWMDMEISSSTSPSNNEMIEFQMGSDIYSQSFTCIPIEEEVYDSLWLQTDLSMVSR